MDNQLTQKSSEKVIKRPKSSGIRIRLILFTALFTVLMLVVIWVLFVVLLNNFYEQTKYKELLSSAKAIETSLESDDLEEIVTGICYNSNASVVVRVYSEDILTAEISKVSFRNVLSSESAVGYLYKRVQEDGGYGIYRYSNKSAETSVQLFSGYADRTADNMLYARIINHSSGKTVLVLISVVLTPVDATTNTIENMLVVVSVVFILLAVVLGAVLARNLSDPLVRLNESARSVGTPEYKPAGGNMGCREIEELNNTLERASSELAKVDELRRELIANVSHDLRTPLTMISGYGEMMRDIPGENTPENIQIIIDEAEHLRSLVNDILSLSKLQNNMDTLDCSVFGITDLLEGIISRYSAMKTVDGYKISFEYDSNVEFFGDELKLSQVFYNLINNAITYSGNDKTVIVKQTTLDEGGKVYLRYDVIDHGDGISQENLPYIWDRYYKENRTHKRAGVGTGFGLSIVKGVVLLHGGEFGVTSTVGEGSDFWVKLPVTYHQAQNQDTDRQET